MSSRYQAVSTPEPTVSETKYTLQVRPSLDRLSKADPANVQAIVASQLELMAAYHNVVLSQARRSFYSALAAAGIGLIFLLAAAAFVLTQQPTSASLISLISGAIVEFISAINFYLYGKTSAQLADFQNRLDNTQRFLLANSICEGFEEEVRQKVRIDLVRTIAGITDHQEIPTTNEPQPPTAKLSVAEPRG